MTVQDLVRLVPQQRQAEAPAPEVTTRPTAPPAPLLGRDRPRTADEQQLLLGLTAMAVVLGTVIVVFLLLARYVWTWT